MKLNIWMIAVLAPLTAAMILAQDSAEAPTKKAPPVKKKTLLDPPATATVKNSDVNVRGRASFTGETIGHLQKGDTVTVLAQITLGRTTQDEPAEWAEIALPAGIPVWVDTDFVDADSKTIKRSKVHMRGGPGENYSVLGLLEKGAAVKEVKQKKGWMAIEAPTNAYAFVAAEYLEIQPPPVAVVTPPSPVPTPTPEPAPVTAPAPEPAVVNVPAPTPAAPATNEPAAPAPAQSDADRALEALRRATATEPAPAPGQAATPAVPAETNNAVEAATHAIDQLLSAPPRVVTREGFVRRSYNIQAPADFELRDITSGRVMDYLQPKAGQNFKIYVGVRVTVTGTEGVTPRWPRTPVLQVQSVDLIP